MVENETVEFKLAQDFVVLLSVKDTLITDFARNKMNEFLNEVNAEIDKNLKKEAN